MAQQSSGFDGVESPAEPPSPSAELPADDATVLRELWHDTSLRVHCLTWNMNAKDASVEDVQLLLPRNRYHIYAVGTQECENTIAKSLLFSSKERWETAVTQAVGEKYTRLASQTLQATHLVVFVHQALVKIISEWVNCLRGHQGGLLTLSRSICGGCATLASALPLEPADDVQTASVACGVGNTLGNKGGCAVGFNVGKTAFLFVASHFAAKQGAVRARNRDFQRIEAALPLLPSGFGFEAQRAVAAELSSAGARTPAQTPGGRGFPPLPGTPLRGGPLPPLQNLPRHHLRSPSAFPPGAAAAAPGVPAVGGGGGGGPLDAAGTAIRGPGARESGVVGIAFMKAVASAGGSGRADSSRPQTMAGEAAAAPSPLSLPPLPALPGSVDESECSVSQSVGPPSGALRGDSSVSTSTTGPQGGGGSVLPLPSLGPVDGDEDDEDGEEDDGQSPRAGATVEAEGEGALGSSSPAAVRSLHDLLASLRVPENASDRYDRVVWMGDLNYRVDLPRAQAEALVKAGDLQVCHATGAGARALL
jgi:hypothetical protein